MTPEIMAVRRRLYEDFAFYAENALKIRTKDRGVVPFVLNEAQRRLHAVVERQIAKSGRVRVIILKGRQMGLSTYVGARLFSQVTQTLPGQARKAIVVTHKGESTQALFDMTQRFYELVPPMLKPATKYSSRKELKFSDIDAGYMLATAGGDGIGRGETITHAHLSELAWWPKNSALANYNGLMEAIPDADGTEVYLESTANGMSGVFFDQCRAAEAGESEFELVFLPWFIEPSYTTPVPPDFKRTPKEEDLVAAYGLSDGQLMFRRRKIASKGEDLFKQEYPCCAKEAFLTSGRPVFNPDKVDEMRRAAKAKFAKSADVELGWEPIARKGLFGDVWEDDVRGELLCYLPFDEAETYYIGADVGAGVSKDNSVAQVFDSKRRQAAVWRSDRSDPDAFGTILAKLGLLYNEAKIICERNNHGILTNRVMQKDEGYGNYYTETVVDRITDRETTYVGFLTTEKSKPLIINKLRSNLRQDEITIYDRVTLDEMQSFIVTEKGSMEAEKGCHDDSVMALALCDHINEGYFEPIENQDDWYERIE
jgi:hypothetical protein